MYLTVAVDINSRSKYNNKFIEISKLNGYPVYINESAEKLIKRKEITIDEGGWYFYKKLIILNPPIVRMHGGNSCRI
ncbi:MAG: hypothetical protein ACTSPY_10665 [Candidatus Helarchaeota archaeon]